MKRFSILLLLSMLCTLFVHAYKKESVDITVNGQQRNMVVFTPSTTQRDMPLMIVTHGMYQDPEYQYGSDKIYELIDNEKFVVTYLRSNPDKTWDIWGTNDQDFVLQTIDEMHSRYGIDKSRVYWSGFSMGSMLMYHCMANVQDKIAAFAPTSGVMQHGQPWNECKKPVNLIHCHAYGDGTFKYKEYDIHGYVENMAKIVNGNTDYKKTANYNPGSWFTGDKEVWSGGPNGGEVELFSYNDGGHWPMDGNAREIWNFCKRFSLQTPAQKYQTTYDYARELLQEWKDTPEMTEKSIYTKLQELLVTYSPDKVTTDKDFSNATSKITSYISIFERTCANIKKKTYGGPMEQPSEFDPNFHIYLCFGQSNMEGNAAVEAVDREYVDPRFCMMAAVDMPSCDRTKGKWYVAYPPLCRDWTGLTPADYFGRTMVENLPESIKVGVINVAVGGSAIELFDKETCASYLANLPADGQFIVNYCHEYNDNPYLTLISLAKRAQKKGVIKGILLHQGCSNNGQADWPQKVKRIYLNILHDLDLNEEETPLLIGELLSQKMGGACWGHNEVIARTPGAIPNSYPISSANCPGREDHLHFTAEGYRMIGERYALKMLDLLDKPKQIDFDASENPFPFTTDAFSPSIYMQGTYRASTVKGELMGTYVGKNVGSFGGWRYSRGIDLSAYNKLVVQLPRAATCKPVLKIFDVDDYLKPAYTQEFGKNKELVVDLHDMKTADGKKVDPSHIYLVGFETNDANASFYFSKVFVSMDGVNPVGIESIAAPTSVPADGVYYDLSGRRVAHPSRGIYIQNGKKVLVR